VNASRLPTQHPVRWNLRRWIDMADEAKAGADEREGQPVGPGLALYQYNGCGYCARVRMTADELGVEIELRDTLASSEHASAVLEATGRRTVPVLRIETGAGEVEWLPESADIVRYLRDRFGS
jgi:glutaredoxin